MLPIRDPPQNKRCTHTESERMKKHPMKMETNLKSGVAILISDKIDMGL